MATPYYADADVQVYHGDCLDVLAELADSSVDSVVTDPPYSIGFMGRAWDSHTDGNEDAAFAYWFSGFVDGEGCFRVQRHERGSFTCTFSIKVRRDERGTLQLIQRFLGGIGTIRDGEGSGNAHPQTTYAVQDKAGCARLVRHFDKYPLRAKKRLDYEPWADAVLEWHDMKRGNRWHGQSDWSRMAQLKARVEGARQYVDPPWSGHGFQDWTRLWAAECYRILKPGGHLLSFGGTRQWHRLAAGIEDAGFEIRDSIAWLYGSGFPKSLDVGKAIDKAAGAARAVTGRRIRLGDSGTYGNDNTRSFGGYSDNPTGDPITAPATDAAKQWDGWGTALKPAHEPIVVARKPLAGTVAANVLAHGVGALNVDGCRVGTGGGTTGAGVGPQGDVYGDGLNGAFGRPVAGLGRWPANVVLDESQAAELDRQAGEHPSAGRYRDVDQPVNRGKRGGRMERSEFLTHADNDKRQNVYAGDTGGASRFFYVANRDEGKPEPDVDPLAEVAESLRQYLTAIPQQNLREVALAQYELLIKAVRTDRSMSRFKYVAKAGTGERPRDDATAHPTVKPLALMRWLVRLVTPPGGLVLDPFAGSGTTAEACILERFRCITIEHEAEYLPLIVARITKPLQVGLDFGGVPA